MSWAVGEDLARKRHIGYGVPAICDHPGCDEQIDRGLEHRCGDLHEEHGCALYFCGYHLYYVFDDEGDDHPDYTGSYCERCCDLTRDDVPYAEPYEPTPDTVEWASHVLNDESWAQFREEEPEWTARYKEIVDNA